MLIQHFIFGHFHTYYLLLSIVSVGISLSIVTDNNFLSVKDVFKRKTVVLLFIEKITLPATIQHNELLASPIIKIIT